MAGVQIYEFDALTAIGPKPTEGDGLCAVPASVFAWLEEQCLRISALAQSPWLRLTQRRGQRAVQVTSFVGVIRSPDGFQIEILPKVGKAIGGGAVEARQLLIDMLRCLQGFRHLQTDRAKLAAIRMPLLEVFIEEFLRAVALVVKRGLHSDYQAEENNLFALRGKLVMAAHLRQNLFRADRFFTAHDEYSADRPENRVLRAALGRVLGLSASRDNLKLARELEFVFADVPASVQVRADFQRARLDRSMSHYADALAWARLVLDEDSPLSGAGGKSAPSLLFPMEAVFEAFVAKHLADQVVPNLRLKSQVRNLPLVRHLGQGWFQLRPDLLIRGSHRNLIVLDTKWKLLDQSKSSPSEKYGLSQSDFYQLQAYGQSYLDGEGDVILVHPRTDAFTQPLPMFEFPKSAGLRLWVMPFCLKSQRLIVPSVGHLARAFEDSPRTASRP